MNLAEKYPFIVKWGQEMRSHSYYVDNQLAEAEKDKAPTNAIYRKDGKWQTTDDIWNAEIRRRWGLEWRAEDELRENRVRVRGELDRALDSLSLEQLQNLLTNLRQK